MNTPTPQPQETQNPPTTLQLIQHYLKTQGIPTHHIPNNHPHNHPNHTPYLTTRLKTSKKHPATIIRTNQNNITLSTSNNTPHTTLDLANPNSLQQLTNHLRNQFPKRKPAHKHTHKNPFKAPNDNLNTPQFPLKNP